MHTIGAAKDQTEALNDASWIRITLISLAISFIAGSLSGFFQRFSSLL